IRAWFAETGFQELWFDLPEPDGVSTVGAHRMTTAPQPFVSGARLFTFIGDGSGA
ncbi:MAG: SAM-dependent methyltransferase, partial [Acidimicrobiia bacterium]|nr:SAM-dependent methyltransferase [Acidimicrobiia bacterium]